MEIEGAVPGWRRSRTLDSLQELVDAAQVVPLAVAKRAGVSATELHAMRHLMTAPLGPMELAQLLGVTSAASTGVVDRLCARGHAERTPHPADRRRTVVHPTESGRRAVICELAPMFVALAELDADLDDAERAVVDRFLARATQAVRGLL